MAQSKILTRYHQQVEMLFGLKRTSSQRTLAHIRRFLGALPPSPNPLVTIQIVGTNGKGSTASFLESMFRKAGRKTGMFSSPHLHAFEERFRIDGKSVLPGQLAPYLHDILSLASTRKEALPFFDLATALAVHLFAQEGIEVAIIEAGMGGAQDASTALSADCTILTSIGLDHQRWLGSELSGITREKAGAFRQNIPVFSGVTKENLSQIITEEAHDCQAGPVWQLGRDFSTQFDSQTGKCSYHWHPKGDQEESQVNNISLRLHGDFQRQNFALAASAFRWLSNRTELWENHTHLIHSPHLPQVLRDSANGTTWPGRMQRCQVENTTIWLDGAHNPEAILALQRNLPSGPFRLIFGCSNDKPISSLLLPLLPFCQSIHFCPFQQPRSAQRKELEPIIQDLIDKKSNKSPSLHWSKSVKDAIALAMEMKKEKEYLLITGSLFIVAEAIESIEI